MNLISYFLLVLYASCFLARPAVLSSEKSQNPNTFLNFSQASQVAKAYTTPLFQNTGNAELKNSSPFNIAILLSAFNFKKAIIRNIIPDNHSAHISGYKVIEWPKISINAP